MLKESDISFRELVNEINAGTYICDLDGKLIYANRAFANIFGITRTEVIIGRNIMDLISPSNMREKRNQFLKSITGNSNSPSITAEVIKDDGTMAVIEIDSSPFIKSGKLLGGQGVVHNITSKTQMEEDQMYLSTHDFLSGLYNHAFFSAELKRIERGRQFPISIIVIIVDFRQSKQKPLDQETRNKLIKRFAHRVFKFFRGDDIVARICDDEFAILLPTVGEDYIDTITQRIRENLSEFVREEHQSGIGFYMGAGISKDGAGLNSVLKQAESISYLERKKNSNE
jgi:PAS domain S-box-containing protein/diguanylate cyclase (GGDEF)-like protein